MNKQFLSSLKPGETAEISGISGGHHFRHKLINLGLLPGTQVQVVLGRKHSPLVIIANGTKMMIGRGMALKIEITPSK